MFLWQVVKSGYNQNTKKLHCYHPLTKLREGYVFTGMRDSVHRREVPGPGGGVCSMGGLLLGGCLVRGESLLLGGMPGPKGSACCRG